jgi:DNA-binding beta-propeller fold protein YncE
MRIAIVLCCFFVLAAGPMSRAQDVPRYKVDPSWPKELPNNWLPGAVHGIAVDKEDHVWLVNAPRLLPVNEAGAAQTPPRSACCVPAPSVIEFDAGGTVLRSWGGPGYLPDWPTYEHGIWVDGDGNVWMAGNSQSPDPKFPGDRQVFKFSKDGKQLLEIGHPTRDPVNNQDTTILGAPAEITVDDAAHEAYIADGFLNRRVVVFDSNTGAFKRGWGAYGIPLSEIDNSPLKPYDPSVPSKQFRGPVASVRISVDGFVYACDRSSDRIQVFTKEGKFIKEFFVRPATLNLGSTWGLTFSHDAKQKYLLVSDGENGVVWILNRNDGSVAGQFGRKGSYAGQFAVLQGIAMDSHGNVFTSEVNPNARIQKFVLQK